MVTSYVPVDPMAPDRSILRGPRANSDLEVLYCQWAEYRMESLASRMALISKVKSVSPPPPPSFSDTGTLIAGQPPMIIASGTIAPISQVKSTSTFMAGQTPKTLAGRTVAVVSQVNSVCCNIVVRPGSQRNRQWNH